MICRLCLNKSTVEILNIFDAEGIRLKVADIISKYFWFSPSKDDPISDKICYSCWTKVNNFHEFYCFVENAQKNLSNIMNCSNEVMLANVKEEHIQFTSDSDEDDVKNVLDIESTENFEIVLNKQDPIADIKVDTDEDAKDGITFENNSSKTKNQRKCIRKSNLNKQCDNEKNKEQFEENSATDKETTEDQKNSQSKKSKTSKEIQTKSRSSRKLKEQSLDLDDTVTEKNSNTTALIQKSNRSRCIQKDSEQQKRKIKKKKLDTDDDVDEDLGKFALIMKIKEEDELIAQYIRMDCDICSQSFSTFSQLKSHIKKVHHRQSGYVKCCNKKIFKRALLLDHVNFHINPNVFSCLICDKKFENGDNLKYHVASHHDLDKSDLLSCDQCQKQFIKKSILDKHKLTHAPPEERHYKCEICQKKYPSSTHLKVHIRSVHERKYDLVCDICAKKLPCKKLLDKHRLEHDGITEPKVQCPKCGSWHKNERNLKEHMRFHNKPLYKCEICGIQASRKYSITRHMNSVHLNQRDFKCTFCEKAFNRNKALIEHMTTHTGDILYTCTFCPQTFNSSANMYSHRKKIHPKEWEELNKKRST